MSLRDYIQAVPKAELHVHLEGAIQPETLLELARRNKVPLPADSIEGLRRWFIYSNFDHFIDVYLTITRCLRTTEDYELITYEFGREMARQNILYAEVTFSPSTHDHFGVMHDVYFTGLCRGRERARVDFGVRINWIFDIVRNASSRVEAADYTTQVAIDSRHNGVLALGLGGKEAGFPAEFFAHWFDEARAVGLRSAPHAGEMDGPESIWQAIRSLGADRIGHGVRAIDDPALVAYLAEKGIPLEISPTSNICLGVYDKMERHPFKKLYKAGVIVTINSDDPALFNTTLENEIEAIAETCKFSLETLDDILLASVRHSFLPAAVKAKLDLETREAMAQLKAKFIPSFA